jgi:hypothetical protein
MMSVIRHTAPPAQIAEALRECAREGINEVQIVHSPNTVQGIEGFAPILESLDRG